MLWKANHQSVLGIYWYWNTFSFPFIWLIGCGSKYFLTGVYTLGVLEKYISHWQDLSDKTKETKINRALVYILKQWFSTFSSRRPTIYNTAQYGDPYITIIVLKHRFRRPKRKCTQPKSGSRPTLWEPLLSKE